MAQPILLTPRQNFQTDKKRLSAHRDLVSTEAYNVGVATALLQYQCELAQKSQSQYDSMAMGIKLQGAQELLTKMWELGVVPEIPKALTSESLDHHV